ncbi:hypothetical protein CSKR_100630 [Clonorchis sinensis]|uniref:Uncharacterized protein n=1 Tax=Clonorchis sinensis TaxID=79923 RepID=A0A3R7G8T1_CLOSI|nr:hypothetical protein CSKR_100630 [Clonorchis sinensis]
MISGNHIHVGFQVTSLYINPNPAEDASKRPHHVSGGTTFEDIKLTETRGLMNPKKGKTVCGLLKNFQRPHEPCLHVPNALLTRLLKILRQPNKYTHLQTNLVLRETHLEPS